MKKDKQERTVIHLQIGDKHYYFGSLAAIYTMFNAEAIGIGYGALRNFGLTEKKPYINEKKDVVIRKGLLKTIEGNRGKNNS